ncbi:hypothetical protein PS1_007136 [Malus domestica]
MRKKEEHDKDNLGDLCRRSDAFLGSHSPIMAFPAMQLQLSYTKTVIVIISIYLIQIIKAMSILLVPHAINVQALNPLMNGATPRPQHRRERVSELCLQPYHLHDGTVP